MVISLMYVQISNAISQYLDTCMRRALFRKLCLHISVRSNQQECQWKSAHTSLERSVPSLPWDALIQHRCPLVPKTRHKCSLLSHTDRAWLTQGSLERGGNRLPVEAPQIWSLRFLECICTLCSQGNNTHSWVWPRTSIVHWFNRGFNAFLRNAVGCRYSWMQT